MRCPVIIQSDKPVLFKTSVFRHGDLTGLDRDYSLGKLLPLQYRSELTTLHKQLQNANTMEERISTQKDIDQYLLCVAVFTSECTLASVMPPSAFLMHKDALTIPDYDIGSIIRAIIINQDSSNVVMFKIMQYCLPYIKHNRLNFPDVTVFARDDLVALIHMMIATCLGLYEHVNRKPTWNSRVCFFWMAWQILQSGSMMDMHIFCRDHMSIMRLSVIEYFVFFLQKYMPVEESFIDKILGLSNNINSVFAQFLIVIDNFRAHALQEPVFDMHTINTTAQICIDKCNRICKGKSKNVRRNNADRVTLRNIDSVKTALSMPMMGAAIDVQMHLNTKDRGLSEEIYNIQSTCSTHKLPSNMFLLQVDAILDMFRSNTMMAYACMTFYYCFYCQEESATAILGSKMRINNRTVTCLKCSHSDTVAKVNTMGRIVKIKGNSFYFCVTCLTHHSWKEYPPTLMSCCKRVKHTPAATCSSKCFFCSKNTSMCKFRVLDTELGIIQELNLCINHRPQEREEHIIYSLGSLTEHIKYVRTIPLRYY